MEQESSEFSNRKSGKTLSELGDIVAFVGHEVEFSGVLTYKGNVRIDGTFDGEIETPDILFVGEQANVKAQISAGSVIASGRITGDITASQRVELKSPAIIDASISTPKLSMDNGVIFNGKVTMGSSVGQSRSSQNKSKKNVAPVTPVNKEEIKPAEDSTVSVATESTDVGDQEGTDKGSDES